jgi:7-cyano-7-deazaguanine reductase
MKEPKHLGRTVSQPTNPNYKILDVIQSSGMKDMAITFACDEFTSICPVTGQRDYGTIIIEYIPATSRIIETKSLKLYLGAFANKKGFVEVHVRNIYEDIHKATDPMWLRVTGEFVSRGGIRVRATIDEADEIREQIEHLIP